MRGLHICYFLCVCIDKNIIYIEHNTFLTRIYFAIVCDGGVFLSNKVHRVHEVYSLPPVVPCVQGNVFFQVFFFII